MQNLYGGPNRTNFELVYYEKGEALNLWDGGEITMKEGRLALLPPNLRGYTFKCIRLNTCYDIYLNLALQLEPRIYLFKIQNREQADRLFSEIHRVWNQKKVGYYYQCMALTYQILALVSASDYTRRDARQRIEPAVELLRRRFAEPELSIKALCGPCEMSYTNFRRIFKRIYGVSAIDYLIGLRIDRAVELLHCTDYPIKQIAELSGFTNPYYFSRLFTERMGVNPSKYRGTNQ